MIFRYQKISVLILLGLFILSYSVNAGSVTSAVSSAFQKNQAGSLKSVIPENARIQLSIPAIGVKSGNYSRSQALALLRKAFSNYRTVSFKTRSSSGAIRGEWVVKHRKTGKEKSLSIYVTFKNVNNQQVITSIRGG